MTTTDGNQYSFMQEAINVLNVKASTLASLFAVEAHNERARVTDLDKSSRSDAQSLLAVACAACLLILVRAYLHKGGPGCEDRLLVLLRIT